MATSNRANAYEPPPFGKRLRVRLTLSYMAVTVLTLFALFMAYVGILALQFSSGFSNPEAFLRETQMYRPALASFWHQGRLDSAGLQASLDRFRPYAENQAPSQVEFNLRVAVTNQEGMVLASSPQTAFKLGVPLRGQISAESQIPLVAALGGDERPEHLTRGTNRNMAAVAGPIKSLKDEVLGSLYIEVQGRLLPGAVTELLSNLLPILASILVGGFIVSVALGAYVSKRLVSRFAAMSRATASWKQGDFSQVAPTQPGDELGHLGSSLNDMALQMKDLLNQREQMAIADERVRLARDLHDTVKQHTFAAAMQLATAQKLLPSDQPAAVHIANAMGLVEQSRQDLAAMLLRSTSALEAPLHEAIGLRLEQWSRHTGIAFQSDLPRITAMKGDRNHAVLRILDEALANVARHSQANSIQVTLSEQDGIACMELVDDGVGFDEMSVDHGMGLANLRSRAAELPSGHLSIESEPDRGCRIVLEWRPE